MTDKQPTPPKQKVLAKPKSSPKAKAFYFVDTKGEKRKLTRQQKLFCHKYLEMGANGIDAVIEAGYNVYGARGVLNRHLAASIASENLTKPDILAYLNIKYDEYGYGDDNVIKQHIFLLNQNSDLSAKKGAIDMFYKKKGDYAPEKHQHTIRPFGDKTDDELAAELNIKT